MSAQTLEEQRRVNDRWIENVTEQFPGSFARPLFDEGDIRIIRVDQQKFRHKRNQETGEFDLIPDGVHYLWISSTHWADRVVEYDNGQLRYGSGGVNRAATNAQISLAMTVIWKNVFETIQGETS